MYPERRRVTKQPLQRGNGIEEAVIIIDTRSHLPEPTWVCRSWHHGMCGSYATQPGCRGFTGPVPPPLWIRFMRNLFSLLGQCHRSANSLLTQAPSEWTGLYTGLPQNANSRTPERADSATIARYPQGIGKGRQRGNTPRRQVPGKSPRFPENRNRWYNPHIAGSTDLGCPDREQASGTPRRRV